MEETFGRYRLLEPLGRGGMAEVYKAKSFGVEGFEKVLVVKRILPDLARDRRFVELFVHEAKLAVRLSHANIVQAFDLGKVPASVSSEPESYYIAMEYVAGLDVASLLARARYLARQLPIGLCLFITAEVAKGLDHAHRRCDERREPLNIVHRDVSPQNILLSWEGEVKITDFGIAKAREAQGGHSIRGGRLSGKAAYMSPEQARSQDVDARSDLFSLGTVLYELLTGVNPFRALTPGDTLERVKRAEVQPVQVLRSDVSDELAAIVAKALAVDPEDRFEGAGRLHDDILAFMYASGTRFSSNDLIEFLDEFRDVDASEFEVGDILDEGLPSMETDVTPAELTSVRPPEAATPVRITTRLPVLSYAASLGERREATLLVLGLGNGERWAADDLRRRVKDTLGRYGARLIEEEPSKLISLFGLGDADGRDTETAVRCALVLLRLLATGRMIPRAGVHCGMVHLHESGEPARDDNLAALVRVADDLTLLGQGRCVVSSTAARQVRNLFVLDPPSQGTRATVATPGLLVGEVRTPDDALRRFVGREKELRKLAKVLGAAARRQLRVVTVRGEQGMGKTRFLHALERRLRRRAYNIGFYMASCPPRGGDRPLSGLTTMLRVLCGIEEGDSEERVAEVEPRLRALGLTDEERSAVLGQLGACEVEVTGPAVPPLRAAFARMLQRLCEDRIHAFVFDDAQSLDADSWDVLSYAAQRLTNLRAVIVLSTRSFEDHTLADAKVHEVLELGELEETETEHLVAARAGLASAPPDLVAFCRERAGGHPLFLEELVKELLEGGALEVRGGELISMRLTGGEVAVPRHLRSLLGSRIARLNAETKAVLHAAAVLGDPADSEVLSAMLAVPLKQIDAALTILEERGMLRRAGPSASNLASPMLREVVLETIAVDGKQRLHAAAVAAYECVLGEQAETIAERLAAHLLEADQRDRAGRLFMVSAQRRSKSGQLEAAVQDFLRAMNLLEFPTATCDELLGWLEDMRAAVHRVRVAPNLDEVLDNVLERVDASDNTRQRVLARVHGAAMAAATHVFDTAATLAEQALTLAGDDEVLRAKALLCAGSAHGMRGEFRLAVDAYAKISPSAALDPGEAYRLQIGLAQAFGASGDPAKALVHLDRAARAAPPRDLGAAVECEKLRALISHFSRDFHEAAAASQRGVELARAAGLSYEIALGLHNLGDSLLWLDESARAHAAFQQSFAVCEQFGYSRLLSHDRMYLTFLDGGQGDAQALDTLRELIREADSNGLTWDALNGRYLLGALALRRGDRALARRELELVHILARECQSHLHEQSARELLEDLDDETG